MCLGVGTAEFLASAKDASRPLATTRIGSAGSMRDGAGIRNPRGRTVRESLEQPRPGPLLRTRAYSLLVAIRGKGETTREAAPVNVAAVAGCGRRRTAPIPRVPDYSSLR